MERTADDMSELSLDQLVELERREIRTAPDGSRAIILRPNKRRRRIVNMPLTPAAEATADVEREDHDGQRRSAPRADQFAAVASGVGAAVGTKASE